MVKYYERQSLSLFIIFITLLVVPSLGVPASPTDFITYCLTSKLVTNFTLFPPATPSSDDDSFLYYNLLNFSIQNLRFVEPTFTKPIAIVLPQTKEQLASTVLCCRQALLVIRVRCGGHSYEGLSSVASDGVPFVIIDMMNLNRVSVDMESKTAWVEGGATLGETYYAIAESSDSHGFSAGSCPTVGSGGHIAGGGFGLLSRKYGLAADNVVDALVLDADGRMLDREAMGEDVFWAIRGGGGGIFGIIYAWKIRLLQVPQVVTGFIVSRPGTMQQVAELVHKWQFVGPQLEDAFYLSAFVGAGLPQVKTIGISATFKGFYLGPRAEAIAIINRVFPELGIKEEDCKQMSWIESILFFSGLPSGSSLSGLKDRYLHDKGYFKAKSDYVKVAIPMGGIKSALRILDKEPKGYVILDPYGGIMSRISPDSIPFPHRKGNLFTIQYLVEWKEAGKKNSNELIDWMTEFYQSMTPFATKDPRAAYVNYVDLDLGKMDIVMSSSNTGGMVFLSSDAIETARAWGEKYFLNNYDRLVKIKTFVDPNNVFNNQQGIPPISLDAKI
ncbi:Reticuline oxidase [Thalictrum thalictroides]|uniref:Reticuline oxidase n=1 Tax=Thalictrum thalictroides TaxID=46969 RepID=A0A7J6WSH0_THATH|nr:Reticuline oxidase [Thalictrum thalictroides]